MNTHTDKVVLFVVVALMATGLFATGTVTDVSDDLPTSAVRWVCPDEPFAAGIGKPRYYRKSFETKEGLV